jgi:hypothetical protein
MESCSSPKHLIEPRQEDSPYVAPTPSHLDSVSPIYTNDPMVVAMSPRDVTPPQSLVESNQLTSKPKTTSKFVSETPKEITMGKLIYDIPNTMKLRRTYIVKIRINRDTTQINITQNINTKRQSDIKTTSSMQVELVDPSPVDNKKFDIVKNNSDVQMVETDDYTEWSFSVTPIRSGTSNLNVVVSIIKGDLKKQMVYSDSVTVKTDTVVVVKNFWGEHWQWLFTTILIPVFVWLWNKKTSHLNRNNNL